MVWIIGGRCEGRGVVMRVAGGAVVGRACGVVPAAQNRFAVLLLQIQEVQRDADDPVPGAQLKARLVVADGLDDALVALQEKL